MKKIVLAFLLFSVPLFAQQGGEIFHNEELGWTIRIPGGFTSISEAEAKDAHNEGIEAIEEAYSMDVESNLIINKTLFAVKNGFSNYFEANIQAFDISKDGDYEENCKLVYEMVEGTYKNQLGTAGELNSKYEKETIGGKQFLKFTVVMSLPNNFKVTTIFYNRLFGKNDFTVAFVYLDEDMGKLMLEAFKESTFNK